MALHPSTLHAVTVSAASPKTRSEMKTSTIVNNESSEIIRMFNKEFNHLLPADKAALDFYPEELRAEIDGINDWVYDTVNSEFFCQWYGDDW